MARNHARLMLAFLLASPAGWAADSPHPSASPSPGASVGRIVRPPLQKARITGLTFDQSRFRFESAPAVGGGKRTPMVRVEGKFDRADWTLLFKGKPVGPATGAGEATAKSFSLTLPLEGKNTRAQFQSIGPLGGTEQEEIELRIDDWEGLLASLNPGKEKPAAPRPDIKRGWYVFSGGPSYYAYSQTGIPDFTQLGTTAKFFLRYLLFPPDWDLGASAFYTLLPIVSSRSGITASFLGLNIRAGYALPFVKAPWRLSILGGLYYTTMFVSQNAFGFVNLTGPQLFPTLSRSFASGDVASFYLKLSPMTNGLVLLSLSSRELAIGGGWSHPLEGGRTMSFNLDISNMQLVYAGFAGQTGFFGTNLTTYNLSVGYGW